MSTVIRLFLFCVLTIASSTYSAAQALTTSLQPGKAEMKSAGALTFGPDGILFVAAFYSATLFALDTGDRKAQTPSAIDIENVHKRVAALLGTRQEDILLNDLAVSPISHKAYISVSRGRGAWPNSLPVILRLEPSGSITILQLD